MKKFISLFITLAFCISICGCNAESVIEENEAYEDSVVYEEYEEYDSSNENIEEPASTDEPIGLFTVEEILEETSPRFFIHYPDDSFDFYYSGNVLNWGHPELYTYGIEQSPSNLLIASDFDQKNLENAQKGELVFVSPECSYVYELIFPVIESGYAMSGVDFVNTPGVLLFTNEYGTNLDYFESASSRTFLSKDIATINGIPVGEEQFFTQIDGNKYVSLTESDIYNIGEVQGSAIIEAEYEVDLKYYLHTDSPLDHHMFEYSGEAYSLNLQPTTEGYATVDLSELPSGDYIIMYSYWNDSLSARSAYMTHIRID